MPDISHYWQHARARPLRQAGGGSGRLKTQNGGGSSVQISTMVEIMIDCHHRTIGSPTADRRNPALASRLFFSP
jgi:hypothetical protein